MLLYVFRAWQTMILIMPRHRSLQNITLNEFSHYIFVCIMFHKQTKNFHQGNTTYILYIKIH